MLKLEIVWTVVVGVIHIIININVIEIVQQERKKMKILKHVKIMKSQVG